MQVLPVHELQLIKKQNFEIKTSSDRLPTQVYHNQIFKNFKIKFFMIDQFKKIQ